MHELIHDLALSIVMAWLLGVTANFIRQPLILAYLVAGFLLGPSGLKWVQSEQSINTIAELGLIFMLFMIGLEIDLKKIVQAGNVILATSAVQVLGCFVLALGLFLLIGIPLGDRRFDALYLAAAVALSSTVVIVKVLYEKNELDTLPGRITLGVLVVQDLFAILCLAIQPSLNDLNFDVVLISVLRVAVLLASAMLFSRYVLPHLFHLIARLPELVLVGALAWCFAVAEFADFLGLSREMGALIAGVSLSTFPYALDVTAKVTSLRDFFITLFFVALGMMVPVPTLSVLALALILVAFTLASRILTVFPPLYAMRQGLRASILPAINLAQISEFSLVLIQVGVQSGQTTPGVAGAASTAFVVLAVLEHLRDDEQRPDHAADDPHSQTVGLPRPRSNRNRARSREQGRAQPPNSAPRILPGGQLVPDRVGAAPRCAVETDTRGRFQSHRLSRVAGAGREGPLWRHRPRRHALACRRRPRRNRDFERADSLLKGPATKSRPACPHGQSAAKIIATADVLSESQTLYAAGADYVSIARLDQANELIEAVTAAEAGLLDDMRAKLERAAS